MSELAAHLTLLGAAFLAATIVPGSSELVLVGLVLDRPEAVATLFLAATIGNTAGSAANYVLGRWFLGYATRRWLPASQKQLDRAGAWFGRYGAWSLLLAWLPIVGDALTVIAGTVRMNIYAFLSLVGLARPLDMPRFFGAPKPFDMCSDLYILAARRRSELAMTLADESAIAVAATSGQR